MQPYCSHDCGETDSTKRRKLKRLNVIVTSWRIEFIYRIRVLEFQNLDFSDNSRCIRKCFNETFNDFNWDLLLSDLQLKIDQIHNIIYKASKINSFSHFFPWRYLQKRYYLRIIFYYTKKIFFKQQISFSSESTAPRYHQSLQPSQPVAKRDKKGIPRSEE